MSGRGLDHAEADPALLNKGAALERALFPEGGVALCFAYAGQTRLRPLSGDEAACVEKAPVSRQTDFRLGRHCAHAALDKLGASALSLLPGPDRAPAWPAGVSGSISHSAGHAVAVAAFRNDFPLLGIDMELRSGAFTVSAWRYALTQDEISKLSALPHELAEERAHLWFSAKESAFKAAQLLALAPPLPLISLQFNTAIEPVAAYFQGRRLCSLRSAIHGKFNVTAAYAGA